MSEIDPSYAPIQAATTTQSGLVKKAVSLTTGAVAARTNNTGGTVQLTLPIITGAVYATDSGAIKNAITTNTTDIGSTNARLEELIAKLQAAGVLS